MARRWFWEIVTPSHRDPAMGMGIGCLATIRTADDDD
jgi:hypothetical protein